MTEKFVVLNIAGSRSPKWVNVHNTYTFNLQFAKKYDTEEEADKDVLTGDQRLTLSFARRFARRHNLRGADDK